MTYPKLDGSTPVADNNTMAKKGESHSEMAHARQSDGINVIFDQNTPGSSHTFSRSRSRSTSSSGSSSYGSGHYRGRRSHRGRYRSSSSESSSTSSSSSVLHAVAVTTIADMTVATTATLHHAGTGPTLALTAARHREISTRIVGATSPALDPALDPAPGRLVIGAEKRELLKAAKANAMKILGVEKLELPESVKSILSEQSESKWESAEPRVRKGAEKTRTQREVEEPGVSSSKGSPKRTISFSPNNSVAKPTVAVSSSAKVTPRVDSYESRMPYGHWIPIKPVQTSNAR
ncbi:Arginine/serine-rich protein 1 [Channa argus]|uniref:Arginine/serine-rich protein 1 n=1 Tax=Channa argus TaxID=215402 RepID=A0A6G1QG58_CHAAH|nr:Arginine/serine-rich protein 1 [Channa argus]